MINNNLQTGGGKSRLEIIDTIGRDYLTSNIENGEFSYATALRKSGKDIKRYKIQHKYIDLIPELSIVFFISLYTNPFFSASRHIPTNWLRSFSFTP